MKQVSNFLLLCFTLMLLSSCVNQEPKIEAISELSQEYERSLDDALQSLDATLEWIDKPTRGSKRQILTIETLSRRDVFGNTTRFDAASTGNLLYIVNFGNEEGYAVLSADSRLDPVLLVADSGSADPADYTVPEDIYLQDSIRPGSEDDPFAEYWCEEDEDHYIGNDGIPDIPSLLLGCTERVPIWADDQKDEDTSHGNLSSGVQTPLIKTAWHQSAPFNNLIYVTRIADGIQPAGCTTIATAQAIAYLGTKGVVDYDFELVSNWSDITLTEENRKESVKRLEIESDIARFVKKVADGIDVMYGFFGGTFATPNMIKQYLKDIGFSAKRHVGYKTEIVKNNLNDGKPVIIGALGRNSEEKSGHAWIIDGFRYDESFNVSMVHCNMGWKSGNGWYANKVFSSYNEDNEYDGQAPTFTYNYTWWFRMVYIEDSLD